MPIGRPRHIIGIYQFRQVISVFLFAAVSFAIAVENGPNGSLLLMVNVGSNPARRTNKRRNDEQKNVDTGCAPLPRNIPRHQP